jgi:hypothetical protein
MGLMIDSAGICFDFLQFRDSLPTAGRRVGLE